MKKILFLLILSAASFASFSQVRISQVYGGGGNSGATIKNDFIELFNAGASPVNIGGWSVQYASATGTTWAVTAIPAATTLPAGRYFLIAEAPGAGGTTLTGDMPTGAINMSGTTGKVALTSTTTALTGSCPTGGSIVDFIGFGATGAGGVSCFEGTGPCPLLTNTTSAQRAANGCTDTDINSSDFSTGTPAPRNLATAVNLCGGPATPTLAIAANITGLTAAFGSVSPEATFTVSGTDLTAGSLTVNSTGNVEIATTSGGSFSNSITLTATAGTYNSGLLYARIKNTAPLGTVSETITVLPGAGAANSPSITVTGSVVAAEPTVQASNIVFSNVTDHSFQFSWTNGDGASRIAVIKLASNPTDAPPVDGTSYTANAGYGLGSLIASSNYVIYLGSGSGPVTVTGLNSGTNYSIKIYEYNGSGTSANYLTSVTGANNPLSQLTTGTAPVNTIQQQNFIGVAVPLYMPAMSSANRVPAMFYATVNNLAPSTAYRYFEAAAIAADLGTVNTAGLPILIDYNNANGFSIPSTASIAAATASGNFGTFTTNASGSFTGSFGIMPSTNARFTAGGTVYPVICLGIDNGPATTVQQRLALDQTLTPLNFGTTAADGTFIKGVSSSTPKNLVALWQSVDGSSFVAATARPQAMTYTENAGATTTVIAGYDNSAGSWNTIIPNNLANGIRLIQQIDLVTGTTVGCNSDADGVWPSGANTVNTNTGTTPVALIAGDADLSAGACFSILAVKYGNFTAVRSGKAVRLNWNTEQEVNSNYTEVLRSTDGVNWKLITTVQGAGNSSVPVNYNAFDNAPAHGKNLYKLNFVDAAGKSVNSEIKSVLFSDKFEISISPNPVKDMININLAKQDNAPAMITLINANGTVVGKYNSSSSSYSINAAGLSKGLYILKVNTGDNTITGKLIIQ